MTEEQEVVMLTREFMLLLAKNSKKAARINEPKVMLAVLINIENTIGSFIQAMQDGIDWDSE
jgi:hypothetical protein